MAHDPEALSTYLAELFSPGCTSEQLRADGERLRAAAEALAASGEPVRYVSSLLLPGEGTALHVLEAERPEAVEHVLREAGLDAERVSPAITPAGMPREIAWHERR